MTRLALAALAALALSLAPQRAAAAPSEYTGSFELRAGTYRPNIDSEFNGAQTPYQSIFGTKRPYAFKLHFAKALPWRKGGTVELGGGAGYWKVNGKALDTAGAQTTESTSLTVIPLQVTATYRLDLLMDDYGVPLVPYARLAIDRYQWWVTGPGGSTAQSGGTMGWSWGGGIGLVLDYLDPTLAREMDTDYGCNHTMLVFDFAKSNVSDFGSGSSWDLSDTKLTMTFGLLFVF